jgi:hypothetical protein
MDQGSFPMLPLRISGKIDKRHDRFVTERREDFLSLLPSKIFHSAKISTSVIRIQSEFSQNGPPHSHTLAHISSCCVECCYA